MFRPHGFARFALLFIFSCVVLTGLAFAQSAKLSDAKLAQELDKMLTSIYTADAPGAAVIVTRNAKPIFRKGYGMADLELGVKMEPDMVFRIGSITKQFTAVAILMLAEQGKLHLSDDLTKFLPDFPTHNNKITVEHLLVHTSGIKSYTDMQEWLPLMRKDMSVQELIDLFKNQPPDFAPDARWQYNNSAYVLLGAIIEKVSGVSYEDFIQKNIFDALGMKHSFYGSASRVLPRRIPGYQKGTSGYDNAAYLSMTQPYAAGSLLSSVDDLALWDAALYTDTLVKQTALQRAWTSYRLQNGEATNYGYGWAIGEYEGQRLIMHGGGINGFITNAIRVPHERIYVAVLTNCEGYEPSPMEVSLRVTALALNKPMSTPTAITLSESALDSYVGVYQIDDKRERVITREGKQLYSQASGGSKREIFPMSETVFFFKDDNSVKFYFSKDAAGKVIEMDARRVYGPREIAKKTEKALPQERQTISVDPASYAQYVGAYELLPNFVLTITHEGQQLMAQATGQPKFEIFPEAEHKFFLKVVDAQIEFIKDTSGKIASLILHQGGRDLPGKRIK